MDPAWTLIAALVALYFVEGLFWVRRAAFGFAGAVHRRRGQLVRPGGPLGNATSVLLPLPMRAPLFVVEPWPLVPTADGLWPVPADTLGGEAPSEVARIPQPGLHRDGKAVATKGGRIATSSPALAQDLVTRLAAPSAPGAAIRGAAKTTHDLRAIEARIADYRAHTRWLRGLSTLAAPALLGATYAFFFVPAATVRWPLLLGGVGSLLLAIALEAFLAHRRLYPDLVGDRWLKLALLVFSPPAAGRVDQWLARDALAGFHPLAVAAVVLDDEAFAAFAGEVWRDLHHPLGPTPDGLSAALTEARAALRKAHRRVLEHRGLDPDALLAGPDRPDDGARAYCPRCHACYRSDAEETCADCPGVALVAWAPDEATTRSSR